MPRKRTLKEFGIFVYKQAYTAIFGGYLLFLMLLTHFWYPIEVLHRYDFIFLAAILFQVLLIAFKFETLKEAKVIIIFHAVATVMELFKTHDAIGSWTYPEEYFFGIGNVPLFTGFMYSAVGSYLARVWRIFDFKFTHYPKKIYSIILVIAIYGNFFSHHFIYDFRWILLGLTIFLFWKTQVHFKIIKTHRKMPLLIGWFLVALFIWFAENIATFANIWVYPNQAKVWEMVPPAKLSSWYLLMMLSFVLVTTVNTIKIKTNSEK